MGRSDLAWLAGYLEGEGCFRHRVIYRCASKIMVSSKDEDVLRRAASLLRDDAKIWQLSSGLWCTEVSGKRAIELMRLLLPLMGKRRGAKIKEILDAEDIFKPNNLRFRERCSRGHLFDTTYMWRGMKLRKCSTCVNRRARESYTRRSAKCQRCP